MPKVNSNASDKQNDAMSTSAELMQNLVVTTNPVVITAVQRKANIGNYETIDLYMAVALPLSVVDAYDGDALTDALNTAADQGFSLVAKATGDRYVAIKESIKSRN